MTTRVTVDPTAYALVVELACPVPYGAHKNIHELNQGGAPMDFWIHGDTVLTVREAKKETS